MGSVIRVNPESVRGYARIAQESFDSMRAELERLVQAVAEVRYFGENAVQFKSGIANMAADFANGFSSDMAAIADHVRAATSNISASLGGQPVDIQVRGGGVQAPSIPASTVVDVDTTALSALGGTVRRHFGVLVDGLDSHLRALETTDWEGNAKETVVSVVRQYTQRLRSGCDDVSGRIVQRINDQVESARLADNA